MAGLIILYVVSGIALMAFVGSGSYVIAALIGAVMIAPIAPRALRAWLAKPSQMVCPNCGSNLIRIESRTEGVSLNQYAQLKRSILMPRHHASAGLRASSRIDRQRIACCLSCGFDYPYVTAQEIRQERIASIPLAVIVCVEMLACVLYGVFA